MAAVLETVDLMKRFETEDIETLAVNGVSLSIEQGEFLAIMGPSGCGKSTLLGLLGMLDKPSNGSLVFKGVDIANSSGRKLSDLRRDYIGFVFQNFNLIDDLSIRENVELPLMYAGVGPSERRTRSTELLDYIGLGHRKDHRPAQLSGGQQQRVAVARALINRPDLILADEPTGNLDSQHGEVILDLLTDLNKDGATIVMVTHSEHQAKIANRIIQLRDGAVVSDGTHTDLDGKHGMQTS